MTPIHVIGLSDRLVNLMVKHVELGLGSSVSGKPYMATAETLNPCQVNFIKREDFLRFLKKNGAACLSVAEHLSNQLPRRVRAGTIAWTLAFSLREARKADARVVRQER